MRIFVGGLLLGATLGLAVLAGRVAPQDPIQQDAGMTLLAPGRYHPFGTDAQGRDVLARVAYGARVSVPVALWATLLSSALGGLVGLAAAGAGGRADRMLMRLVDVALAFPTLALLLVLASLYRADSLVGLILLLGMTTWMPIARLVRADAASVSRRRFMEAAASLGASPLRRVLVHLTPNVLSTLLVAAALQVGEVVLMESGLSFLGLGVAPPTPSWGDMVRQGMPDLDGGWWVAVFPGLALAMAVGGANLIGDGLRDALDPRLGPVSVWAPRPGSPPDATP